MKIGLCSWSYHRSLEKGKIDFDKLLHICAEELKVEGIDIIAVHLPKTDNKTLLEVKKKCTDLQLTISSLSPGNDFGKPTKKERDEEVNQIKKWLEIGYVLGAPVLRIFSGFPGKENRDKLWPEMVNCIRECEKEAKELGITLAIEPHNDGGFLPTAVDTLRLIKEIDSPWVRINLDTGNYHDKDMYKGLKDTIAYAPHIHAKIHQITRDGRELEFDFDKIFQIIKEANYRGFFAVEYEGKEDELEYVPFSIDMIKRFSGKYGI